MKFVRSTTSNGCASDAFLDRDGRACVVQESVARGVVLVGVDRFDVRMSLSRAMARKLIRELEHFVETGELPPRRQGKRR